MKTIFSFQRFFAVLKKEVNHILRDPTTLGLIFVMPLFMIILFGFAVSGEITNIPMAVLDLNRVGEPSDVAYAQQDRDISYADALINDFDNSANFNVMYIVDTEEEIHSLMRQGRINFAVIIPVRYSVRFNETNPANPVAIWGQGSPASRRDPYMHRVHIMVNGADPQIARIAAEAGAGIIYNFSVNRLDGLGGAHGFTPSAAERGNMYTTVISNEMMRQSQFLVPAIISVIIFSIIMVLTSSAIVREKERGTIEQLMTTPMTKSEFMLGKLAPYTVVGFVDIMLILALASFLFAINPVGSVFLFIMLGMIFVLCALGLGILISTISTNQGQALMLSIVFIVPSLILCGLITPVATMPPLIQFVANILPLTHFLEITRGIVISGLSAAYLETHIMALSVFAVAVMALAIFKFKKSVD